MNRLRILLLEDSPHDAELILRALARDGLDSEPIRVETQADYLAALQQERFDVILADYCLPSFDGAAALAHARERRPDVPFIVVSGSLGEERAIDTLKSGATDYVLKQRLERLVPAIQRALREAEERAERQRLEAELRCRAEELAERDRRKDEFLAMLAHELRNPLGASGNALQIMRRLGVNPTLERAMTVLERQVQHQVRIIDDLLDVSRLTRGRVSLQREWLDLGWVIRHTAEDYRSACEETGLAMALELPEEPVWVAADRTRLTQVLGNLLANAVKFTNAGGQVVVQLSVVTDADWETGRPGSGPISGGHAADAAGRPRAVSPPLSRGSAVVTVRDTGIGIDTEMLPHVFESFAQADCSQERARGGLGLGLALVKGFIGLHGGEVQAHSRGLGCGAEFIFTLPMEQPALANETGAVAPGVIAPCRRILIVEDNRDAAETLGDVLELSGHEVSLAFSGPEGVAAARRIRPEVLLCDIGLPGFDGYTVARAVRQEPATASVRLIALSGYGQEEDRLRSGEAGFEHHLIKPVNFDELERLLATMPVSPHPTRSPGP